MRFEPYFYFKQIANSTSQQGISHTDLYSYVVENSQPGFEDKFADTDFLYLISFHSHNKDGFLSFTDFNQMVLPTCNQKLRASATQRT
jgi:hypothetical protein